MDKKMKEITQLLTNELTWLSYKWGAYKQIYGSSQENIDLLNETAPTCFRIIQESLFFDVVLTICRLLDPPKSKYGENVTLSNILEIIKNEECSEVYKKANNLLIKIDGKCTSIKKLRNKRLGHNDLKKMRLKFTEPIKIELITEVIEDIYNFLNIVTYHYEQSTNIFIPRNDGDCLIASLKELREYRDKKEIEKYGQTKKDLIKRS